MCVQDFSKLRGIDKIPLLICALKLQVFSRVVFRKVDPPRSALWWHSRDSSYLTSLCKISALKHSEILIRHQYQPQQLSLKSKNAYSQLTSSERRKAQNPEASTKKMNTRPVSHKRIPRQTSTSYILLYSYAFFIRLDLQRHCFWYFAFLLELDRLGWVFEVVVIVELPLMASRVIS